MRAPLGTARGCRATTATGKKRQRAQQTGRWRRTPEESPGETRVGAPTADRTRSFSARSEQQGGHWQQGRGVSDLGSEAQQLLCHRGETAPDEQRPCPGQGVSPLRSPRSGSKISRPAGDTLAGRFMSLHQSVLDGSWATARHLELFPMPQVGRK